MLSEFGGSALSSDAQQAVATAATSLVSQGVDFHDQPQAGLGSSQSAVTNANNSMSSQLTILQGQLGNLDTVNPTTTATQISSLTNQIQMAYELTARLQQLNLAQYLPLPEGAKDAMYEFAYNDVIEGFPSDVAGPRARGDGSGDRNAARSSGERPAIARARSTRCSTSAGYG